MDKFISVFSQVSSQKQTTQAVIDDCVQQLKAITTKSNADIAGDSAVNAAPNFGFLYATDAMTGQFPELLEQCKTATGIEHWVGTVGLGIITGFQEIYEQPAVSIMLANFDEDEFTIVPAINEPGEVSARLASSSQTTPNQITPQQESSRLKSPRQFATHFGIIHGDPFNPNTQGLIEELQQQVENGFIVGGLTSSRDKHYQIADGIVNGGISGVLFSENINVITNLSQGCSPVGEKHSITKAQENVTFTLDNKPALEVLMQDMKISSFKQLEEKADEVFVGLCIPGSDRSDYTIRNIVGLDPEHKIFAINDYIDEGNEIVFCKRNEQTAIDDMQHMLDDIARRLKINSASNQIKGGIYISCLGRGRDQFGNNSEEVKMIQKTLGDFPLTGFFANGEIHHNKLYGYTGVLTLFI